MSFAETISLKRQLLLIKYYLSVTVYAHVSTGVASKLRDCLYTLEGVSPVRQIFGN